jgi:hypothetical protein
MTGWGFTGIIALGSGRRTGKARGRLAGKGIDCMGVPTVFGADWATDRSGAPTTGTKHPHANHNNALRLSFN